MNSLMPTLVSHFGLQVEQRLALEIRSEIFEAFRRPYLKNEMCTHGALWSQYACPQMKLTLDDGCLEKDTEGYVFVEKRGREVHVFRTALHGFIEYLEHRDDGLFPAVYFVDVDLSVCICETGERGSMRPIWLYIGARR